MTKITTSPLGYTSIPGADGRIYWDQGGYPRTYYSEKVISSLRNNGIPYRRITEMPIASISSKKLRLIPPPRYYVLELDIGMDIRYRMAKGPHPTGWNVCRYNPKTPERRQVGIRDTWIGLDFFTGRNPADREQDYTTLYCTERIIELAKSEKWSIFLMDDPIHLIDTELVPEPEIIIFE